MNELQKIVVLDPYTKITYVIPYDPAAHESVEEAIIEANEHYSIDIEINNSQHFVVDKFKLEIL